MKITPLDIRKQPFRKTLYGLDPDQVNSFLEMVAAEYEALLRSRDEQAMLLKTAEQKLEHYEKIEKVLNETLLTAQKATDEARVKAQKEAELVLKDAQIRAGRYEDDAHDRVRRLDADLVSLKNQRDSFLARFKAMLKTQLELLQTISEDLGSAPRGLRADAEEETMAEVPPQPDISSMDVIGERH